MPPTRPHLLLNAPVTASRLGYPELSGLDLLELFAFIHPARFAVPTPNGLASALGLDPPAGESDAALPRPRRDGAARHRRRSRLAAARTAPGASLQSLARQRWPWAPLLAARLRKPATPERSLFTQPAEMGGSARHAPPRASSASMQTA